MCHRVSNSREAQESRTTERATSRVTSARRRKRCPPETPVRPACCSTVCGSMRPARSAGRAPNSTGGQQRHRHRDAEHAEIRGDFIQARQFRARKVNESAQRRSHEQHGHRGSGGDQQRDFGEQLPGQAPAPGADGRAHGEFPCTRSTTAPAAGWRHWRRRWRAGRRPRP